jgi:hypothetical protein
MAYTNNDILSFSTLFSGNTEAHGVTQVGEIIDGKAKSQSKLVYEPVTPAVIQKHLSGQLSIGIAPIRSDGTCNFGAIDIDDYKYSLDDVIAAIEDFGMPLCPCYSKSKKLHLYIFFEDSTPAEDVQELLRWYANAFACGKKVEIFPKQNKAHSTQTFYSWINLPYFEANNPENHRKLVTKAGTLPLEEAIPIMMERRLSYKEHKQWVEDFQYHDAPPCILSGLLLRDVGPGQRNNWLFSCGVYFRLRDENCDLKTLLTDVNHSLHEPISDAELNATVIKGFNRKTYFYMCASLDRCDKVECRQKEFGIESKSSTGLDFGDLTQFMTDPPYYEWIVNGQKLTFWNEQEILGQTKFRALCLRQLHLVPRKVPDDRWSKILTRACENITVIQPAVETGDFTSGSTFFDLTCAFFNTKRKADNITQLAMGRVYVDDIEKEYVFTAKSFIDFLVHKNDFKQYAPVEMRVRLQQLGAYKEGSMWRMPISSIPSASTPSVSIDFRDKNQEVEDF